MNAIEIVNLLVLKGLIAQDGEEYILTNKYDRLVAGKQIPVKSDEKPKTVVELLSPKELLKKFVKDAEIPYRIKSFSDSQKSYTVTAMSEKAVKQFYLIMVNKKMCYESMVAATKAYYKSSSARKTLSNYICEGVLDVWVEEYEKALESNTSLANGPTTNRVSL